MRVLVIVKATADSEAGIMPGAEAMAAMDRFNEELIAAGIWRMAAGVKGTAHGHRIAFDGESRSLRPGPFGPASEQLAGFWLWEVEDMAQALAWAQRCPNPMPGPSEIEVRPLFEEGDFG
ncbi:MAG: YciI family protein [Sphingomonadales bacterium]|jgi:hypothetical protein